LEIKSALANYLPAKKKKYWSPAVKNEANVYFEK
jgi:hypothetical protein